MDRRRILVVVSAGTGGRIHLAEERLPRHEIGKYIRGGVGVLGDGSLRKRRGHLGVRAYLSRGENWREVTDGIHIGS